MKIDNKDHLNHADLAEASCNWSWDRLKIFSPRWVGGMKIDNKDHLSPAVLAEASCNLSWAELGNDMNP